MLITDAEQHFALDGILGGIVDNFDTDHCKTGNGILDSVTKKIYTEEENFDYPSFGQVII